MSQPFNIPFFIDYSVPEESIIDEMNAMSGEDTEIGGDFLNLWGYNTSGFISYEDECAQQYVQNNVFLVSKYFSYYNNYVSPQAETSGRDVGDEYYGGSTFAYIPTEFQIASAISLYSRNAPDMGPVYYHDPGMNQLLNGLYSSMQDFWKEIARANQTGW